MSDPGDEGVEGWVADLWTKLKPKARAQVRVIAGALSASRSGGLTHESRRAAWWEAHRLAGSLGSYGFADAARAAEELEVLLDGEAEIPLEPAVRLLVRLNAVVSDAASEAEG